MSIACNIVSEQKEKTDLQPRVAIAFGKITSPSGEIVKDATVRFNINSRDSCKTNLPEKSSLWMAGSTHSNAEGAYRIEGKYVHIYRETVCAAIEESPPEELLSALDTTYVWGDSVTFRHQSLVPPIDSVKIDIVLNEPR